MKKWIITGLSGFFALIALLSGRFFACLIALVIGALFLPIPAWQEKVDKYVAKKLKKYAAICLAVVFLIVLPTTESTVESNTDRNMPEVVTEEVVTTLQQETIELPVIEEASEEISIETEVVPITETTTAPTIEATTAPTTQATTVATTAPTTQATTAPTTQATTTPTTQTTVPTTEAISVPETETTTNATEAEKYDYVINTNKGKFHYPSCRAVKQMKEEHKEYYTGTRDELLAKGYTSCGTCHS